MGFTEASRGGFWQWNTPLPYLYCGIAVVLAIIASSLLFLLCSYKDDPAAVSDSAMADDREDDDEKKKKKKKQELEIRVLDPEPKVVVVFGGDGIPLYVAKPQSSSNNKQPFCNQV